MANLVKLPKKTIRQKWQEAKNWLWDFDNPRVNFFSKLAVVFLVLHVDMLYVGLMVFLLQLIFSRSVVRKYSFSFFQNNLFTNSSNQYFDTIFNSTQKGAYGRTLIFACILAPLWEEIFFRLVLFSLVEWKRDKDKTLYENTTLADKLQAFPRYPAVLMSFIIFGLAHGGPINILIQGAGGLFLTFIYYRNNRCWWSPMVNHSLYNFIVISMAHYGKTADLLVGATLPWFWMPPT